MTSAQQKNIVEAQTAFFAASDEKLKEDTLMATEDDLLTAAQKDATVDAPARARQVLQDSMTNLTAAKTARDAQFNVAINANLAYGAAMTEYHQAIADSMQTGAVEKV